MTALLKNLAARDDSAARTLLRELFLAAVAAADPAKVLARHLPRPPKRRCIVVGAGKAAASMAAAVEAAWPKVELSGVVATPYGYGAPTQRIKVVEAAHPVPDANSELAAKALLAAVRGLGRDDLVLALISGGGSSVLSLPVDGLTLADKQAANRALLASGLDIRTMNAVRRRLSAIKGGKLAAAAAPARIVTLAISDIPGDDVGAIASGPTVADTYGKVDLSGAIERLRGKVSPEVIARLERPASAPAVKRAEFRMIATPRMALAAAAAHARAQRIDVEILGDDLEGESRIVGADMARLALAPHKRPKLYISGGETTVTIEGPAGRGGRNTEFLLALGQALGGAPGVWALAGDTDGHDGASDGAAGAYLAPDTLARAHRHGLDPAASLDGHDSGGFFDALGDLLVTGPTCTNVNDFRAILVVPQR